MVRGRRPEHDRDKILEIGAELFTRNGYHATGLKEILEACQVPKGSFYNFFESKEHFAVEILEHYRTIEFDQWEERMAALKGSHYDKIFQMIQQEIERFGSKQYATGCLLSNLAGEVSQSSPLFSEAIAHSTEIVLKAITDDVVACQLEGTMRNDLSAESIAEMLLNHWHGALIRCKVLNSTTPLNNHLDLIASFHLPPGQSGTADIKNDEDNHETA